MHHRSHLKSHPHLRTAVLLATVLLSGYSWAQTAAQQGSRNPNNVPPNSAPTPGTASTAGGQALPPADARHAQRSTFPTPPNNPPGTQPPPGTGQPTPSAMPDLFVRNHFPMGGVEGLPGTGACGPKPASGGPSTTLMLQVGNMGTTAAGAHVNTVVFHNATGADREVKSQRAGGPANSNGAWSVPIPASAWSNGYAHFTATTDTGKVIAEGYEGNNVYTSKCMQPAG